MGDSRRYSRLIFPRFRQSMFNTRTINRYTVLYLLHLSFIPKDKDSAQLRSTIGARPLVKMIMKMEFCFLIREMYGRYIFCSYSLLVAGGK